MNNGENITTLHEIGHGSYSKVYAVNDKEVVKCIETDRNFCSAIREIIITNVCQHPNIISINKVEYSAEYTKIFMNRCYSDLDVIIADVELTLDTIRKFACDIFSACDYLHKIGIIHGDLKPKNLLVDFHTKLELSKLLVCDLGVSALVHEKYHRNTVQTSTYRAPEVNFDIHAKMIKYTTAIDLWSIGCILYEMCVNEPFATFISGIEDSSWYVCQAFNMSICNNRKERMKILQNLDFSYVYKFLCQKLSTHRFYSALRDSKLIYVMASCLIPNYKKRMTAEASLQILTDSNYKKQVVSKIIFTGVDYNIKIKGISNDVLCLIKSAGLQYVEYLLSRCDLLIQDDISWPELMYGCLYISACVFCTLNRRDIKMQIYRFIEKHRIIATVTKIMIYLDGKLL